jgi:biopolymer transport protein ExbD
MMTRVESIAVVLLALFMAAACWAQEEKIKRADLPPAVEKTVEGQSSGATIKGFSKERENGQTLYEAELIVDGHSKDISIDESGTIVEIEEEVAIDRLPAKVKQALADEAGSGKILKVESITKKDRLVAYEAKVDRNGKRSEVQVGPDGAPLDQKE